MAFQRFALARSSPGRARHGRCFHRVLAGVRRSPEASPAMNRRSLSAIASVAYKEFLHILRDRRVLVLLLILPPVFTIVFGHAFEVGEPKNVPAMLINQDNTERTQRFVDLIRTSNTFIWHDDAPDPSKPNE